MLGLIDLGGYWDVENEGDGETNRHTQICGLSKSTLAPFTKIENTARGEGQR